MRVERSRDAELGIACLLKALYTVDETWCVKYGRNCYKYPLGKLGVFDTMTCQELSKLKNRLELAYKVVETL